LWTPNGATPTVIYTTNQVCYGLAVDDAHYAYFAILESRQEACNCPNPQTSTFTTAIVRVSLTDHTSTTLPFQQTRLYGPRAFLVDSQYLYGIDPAFVLRIDKKAFGP
jgi:hypothetical protein